MTISSSAIRFGCQLLLGFSLALWGFTGNLWADDLPDAFKSQLPTAINWAVSPLGGAKTESERNWATNLPKLLVRGWEAIDTHHLSKEEKGAIQNTVKKKMSLQMDVEKSQKLLARDQLAIGTTNVDAALVTWKKEWQDLLDKQEKWKAVPIDSIIVPDDLPLKFVGAGLDGLLAPAVASDRDLTADKTKADYLIWGTVREIAGYLSVRLELYSSIEKKTLLTWTDTFNPDEATKRMQIAHDTLQAVVLGRSWSAIEVRVKNPGATVRIGDGLERPAPITEEILVPSKLTLTIKAPGCTPQTLEETLQENQRRVLNVELKTLEASSIHIVSDPEGAAVWLDSQYQGQTPLDIPRPLQRSRLKTVLEGFRVAYSEVGPKTGDSLNLLLVPEEKLPPLQVAKDDFYGSLALFSFSLTSTIFLKAYTDLQTGLVNRYASVYLANPIQQVYTPYAEAAYWQQGLAYSYYGGAALTTGLFVWMMFKLSDYIKAAEEPLK